MIKPIRILVLVLMLSACSSGGSPAIRYYLLESVSPARVADLSGLRVQVEDVQIPQYLERYQIVTRRSDTELHFSESHQWGDNLRKNLTRVLADGLSQSLGTLAVGTPSQRLAGKSDYRVRLHVTRFERNAAGLVRLAARWQIIGETPRGKEAEPTSGSMEFLSDRVLQDYPSTVSQMSEAATLLSETLAASIAAEAGTRE